MVGKFALLVASLLGGCSHAVLDHNLITDFFAAKFCGVGVIFSCCSKHEKVALAKNLSLGGLRVSFFDVSNGTTSFYTALVRSYDHLAVILDAECGDILPLLQICSATELFYGTYHWLVMDKSQDVIQNFDNVPLTIYTDVNVAIPNEREQNASITQWRIIDVYNPSYTHHGKLKTKDIGYYNIKDGFKVDVSHSKYFRRRNMTGIVFKTAMVIPENITISLEEYMSSEEERYNNTFTRFQSVTIRNCQDFFNFSMNISLLESWGYEQPNGEVNGMVRDIKDKVIDFGLAPLMFKLYRLKLIDFGYGNWIIKSVFIFRHPKSTASSYELYLRPLVTSVWIATVATVVIMVIILRLTVTKELEELGVNTTGGEASWSFLILYGIGEICQQGFSYVPHQMSGRIVIFIVLLFSFLIYQFYSASIVSFLLMEPPKTITTLLDLLNSPLKATCEDSLFDRDYLEKTTNPVAIRLYKEKIKNPRGQDNFVLPEEGMEMVEAGGYAFHTQTSTAYPIIKRSFMEKAICELAEVQMYPTQHMYLSIQKRSPFKKMFNYCLAHQREVGVIDRLKKYWDTPKPICVDAANYFEITLGLDESYWALLVLLFGIIVSLFGLVFEHVWCKKKESLKSMFKRQKPIQPFVN